MTSTVLAISAAYVVIGVLLLTIGLTSRFAWWVKAAAIVVTSVFFVEVFFATKDLLGWPRSGPLPARFQLLWVRVVEPDSQDRRSRRDLSLDRGGGRQQRAGRRAALLSAALFAPARRPLGQGARRDHARPAAAGPGRRHRAARTPRRPRRRISPSREAAATPGLTTVDLEQFQLLQQAQRVEFAPMPLPTLPPKVP